MKRVVICAALFLGAIAVSVYAYCKVEYLNEMIVLRVDALEDVLREDNAEEIIKQTHSLIEFWKEEENILVHFVRHSHIDSISTSMSRLPALSEYGDYSEVHAELLSIRRQMENIRSAELLTLNNLL